MANIIYIPKSNNIFAGFVKLWSYQTNKSGLHDLYLIMGSQLGFISKIDWDDGNIIIDNDSTIDISNTYSDTTIKTIDVWVNKTNVTFSTIQLAYTRNIVFYVSVFDVNGSVSVRMDNNPSMTSLALPTILTNGIIGTFNIENCTNLSGNIDFSGFSSVGNAAWVEITNNKVTSYTFPSSLDSSGYIFIDIKKQ